MLWRQFDFGFFFFQAEDGIRDLVRSRGLGDVYKRQRFGPLLDGLGNLLHTGIASRQCQNLPTGNPAIQLSLIHI